MADNLAMCAAMFYFAVALIAMVLAITQAAHGYMIWSAMFGIGAIICAGFVVYIGDTLL